MSGAVLTARTQVRSAATSVLSAERRRALRHGLIFAGLAAALIVAWQAYHGPAIDAYAYWTHRPPVSYEMLPGTDGAFLYSPAFAQALAPLTALPWDAFLAVWLVLLVLVLAWLAGPLLLLPALVLMSAEILYANIHFLLAAAIVLGFRYPFAWSFVLLTKVTPGIGLLWFVRRREWCSLAIALGATAVIAAVSYAADPHAWAAWFELLQRSAAAPPEGLSALTPLWLRLPIAAAIVWFGAGHNARWIVPVAATLALPVIWPASLALLAGALPLAGVRALRRPWRRALT